MKTIKYLIVIACLLTCGCSSVYFQPVDPESDYRWQIERWQECIKQEGWSESMVKDVVDGCLWVAKYEPDGEIDHWKTYKEFQYTEFIGDCEDISTFMFGTFKRLNYPNDFKMAVIRMPAGDHAVLKVEMPDGEWRIFNSLPMPGDFVDLVLARTVVEWDETHVFYEQD